MYSLHVTVNFPNNTESEYDVPPEAMNLGALEDAISIVIRENKNATSFVFVVTRRKGA